MREKVSGRQEGSYILETNYFGCRCLNLKPLCDEESKPGSGPMYGIVLEHI